MASKIIILVLHIFIFSESLPARAQTLIKVGYWDSGDGFPISDVNFALFTHLMCGFADVNSTTYELSLSPSDEEQFSNFTDTVKIKNPSITTLLSIGGGNNPNYSTYSSMSASSSSRKSFIDSSIKIARLYGFQGLDLSWNSANTSRDKYNIGILFKEWRAAVDLEARNNSSQSQLILTAKVAHSPLSTAAAYPVDSIRQYLNWVHVMTTGYSKPTWTNFTGAHAALYDPNSVSNTEYGITEWIEEGLSADKLVLCLPFYGFAWTLVKPEDNGIGAAATGPALYDDGLVTYKEIKNHIKNYGPNVRVMYNSTYVVNYCSIGKIWFGFDDVEAVRVKVSYAKEKKLRGYYVWEVSYDHYWMLSRAAAEEDNKNRQNKRLLWAIVLPITAACILLIGFLLYYFCWMKTLKLKAKASKDSANSQADAGDFNRTDPDLREYSLADIEAATDRLSIENKLGEGGYGPVYKVMYR
ncbi:hypothetical protein CISIN_1g009209mg [Citrus sinensis]|uniref:GH18 domain-containing protein n=1 Tax=Citrus sinensis TaxID=2711 RepID=A0A067DQQ6_CITSI|nr:hypothetical protein CISIN_1g009209mg [Citrus sinensis]